MTPFLSGSPFAGHLSAIFQWKKVRTPNAEVMLGEGRYVSGRL